MASDTTTETIKALKGLLSQHEARLSENPDFKAAQSLRRTIAELSGEGRVTEVPKVEVKPIGGKPPKGKVSQPAAARAAILAARHPMRTGDILRAMPAHGATIGGRDPKNNLVSILSGHKDFYSTIWHGEPAWWISGIPKPGNQEAAE